jgi:hypothetical protein
VSEIHRDERRPGTVTLVAIFLFCAAAVALITGISLLFPNPFWGSLWDLNRSAYLAFERVGRLAGVALVALAIVTGSAGRGLIKRQKWAWWTATTLFAINGLADVVTLVVTRDLVKAGAGAVIAGAFLFRLTQPGLRAYFDS